MNTPSPEAIKAANRIKAMFMERDPHPDEVIVEIQAAIDEAIEADRFRRRDVLGWEQGYKCAQAESKVKADINAESEDTWKKAYDNLLIDYELVKKELASLKVKEAVRENKEKEVTHEREHTQKS